MSFKGIDISNNNGDVNLNLVKSTGVQAVYMKATEGVSYKDTFLNINTEKAKNSGLMYGYYHFMSEKTDPTQQAVDFNNAIKNTGYNLIPVLDIETNNYRRSATEVTNRALSFLNKFKELTGVDCIIYTYTSFANSYLDKRLSGYKCWIADYNKSQTVRANNVWSTFVGHQYSCSGRISGVSGNVDLNNFEESIKMSSKASVSGSNSQKINTSTGTNKTSSNVTVASNYLGNKLNIKRVQYALNCVGYNLSCDGICGVNTTNAIADFQAKYGLGVDYKFGPKCWSKIYALVCGTTCGLPYKTPQHTKLIQYILGISQDGIFGANTKSKVVSFQKSKSISADGLVGRVTWKYLLGV